MDKAIHRDDKAGRLFPAVTDKMINRKDRGKGGGADLGPIRPPALATFHINCEEPRVARQEMPYELYMNDLHDYLKTCAAKVNAQVSEEFCSSKANRRYRMPDYSTSRWIDLSIANFLLSNLANSGRLYEITGISDPAKNYFYLLCEKLDFLLTSSVRDGLKAKEDLDKMLMGSVQEWIVFYLDSVDKCNNDKQIKRQIKELTEALMTNKIVYPTARSGLPSLML